MTTSIPPDSVIYTDPTNGNSYALWNSASRQFVEPISDGEGVRRIFPLTPGSGGFLFQMYARPLGPDSQVVCLALQGQWELPIQTSPQGENWFATDACGLGLGFPSDLNFFLGQAGQSFNGYTIIPEDEPVIRPGSGSGQ